MKLDYLLRGLPGHPVHPPLTDATIGIYTFATIAALLSVLGIAEDAAAGLVGLGRLEEAEERRVLLEQRLQLLDADAGPVLDPALCQVVLDVVEAAIVHAANDRDLVPWVHGPNGPS